MGRLGYFVLSIDDSQRSGISEYYSLSTEMSISNSPTLEYWGTVNKQLLLADRIERNFAERLMQLSAVHASDIDFYAKRSRTNIERSRKIQEYPVGNSKGDFRFITSCEMSAVVLVRGLKSHFVPQQLEENGYHRKISQSQVSCAVALLV